ncbi:IclR family transcriptional regulator [Pimelobacter simplex]|uniref:IclR family transcriptional regulator n=1 Tax=Nocardioides simplex TaxID=2045 RepID=UPI00214FCF91|nr:IclR family transcriptional regulator [Pimelobacter simplex]UUW90370.1 IclR family transcriptional regulator [Pimelobacter simplex]UUW94200.1 IclR family transcriptional regulator [Pimelobacter simplex]
MRQVKVVKQPPYAVGSVDKALRVIMLLQERDSVRLADVAELLGTSPSTAHRIISTLVYRGFAEQDASHRYRLGPRLLGARREADHLDDLLQRHLTTLREETGATVSAMALEGRAVRILRTVVATRGDHISERTGTTLPAVEASSGKALLAQLARADLHALLTGHHAARQGESMTPARLEALEAELARVRDEGVAYNLRRTEADLVAVGCAVPTRTRAPWLGLAVSLPAAEADGVRDRRLHAALWDTALRLARDLDAEAPLDSA